MVSMVLLRSTVVWVACAAAAIVLLAQPVQATETKKRVQAAQAGKAPIKTTATKAPARKPAPRVPDLTVDGLPNLKSAAALVVDMNDGHTIFAKNTRSVTPIASITKLMTAIVMLDANLPLDETIYVDAADLDFVKNTRSRLTVGASLSRRDMLRLALMSSENRAAASIGRSYPGGQEAFIAAMNRKAVELSMFNTRFVDATGLSSENVSTAEDLVKLVKAAFQYPLIREFTTATAHGVETSSGRNLEYRNSNGLVKSAAWKIGLSKTGYISEAGRCLVMQARIATRSVVIVLLDSWGKSTRTADANRIKKWLETRTAPALPTGSAHSG
jgi:D-alanyl-D-alanine endopeptidase (penicillin-binding protein 7)